ncbi:MAG: lysozyme inhibitor LprI family protein [Lysobacter sp.]
MRLLGIIAAFVLAGCAFAGETAGSAPDCASPSQQELLVCISARVDLAEKRLQQSYAQTSSRVDAAHRQELNSGQEHWQQFRNRYCQSVYDEISPGREAPIEKLACREQLAIDRTAELDYILAGPSSEGFAELLSALDRVGYARDEVVARLGAMYAHEEDWVKYLSAHCELLASVTAANIRVCRARVNIERGY